MYGPNVQLDQRAVMPNGTVCNDKEFGPTVHNCRDDFDFTLVFENTILSIAPSVLVLTLAVARIFYLRTKPKLIWESNFLYLKLAALSCYASLQIALVVLWTVQPELRSWSSVLAASLSLFNAIVFCSISYLEHGRNKQPSAVLVVYFLFSTLFDIVRTRTLWLVAPESQLTRLFTASVVFKALVLVLESIEKAKYLPVSMVDRRPEETSSILNRGIFYWLNPIMMRGSRNILHPEDLYELDQKMTAEKLGPEFLGRWQQLRTPTKHSAIIITTKTLIWPLLAPVFPRAVLTALTVAQPILLHQLLTYLSKPAESTSKNTGYGLIGAYVLVYMGSAIATGFYNYKHYQFLTMVRGCLVSAISWRTASLNIVAVSDPKAAVTLMSTDIQRITDGFRQLHDFWANAIQIGVAMYLLQHQMGVACIVPVVIALISSGATTWISKPMNKKQGRWMEAVQSRIGLTSATLSSMKGVKMRGLTEKLSALIERSRLHEVKVANQWRLFLLFSVAFSFIPQFLSPVATFAVYILQARSSGATFDVARAFTTLSLLVVMTEPLGNLLQAVPSFVSAFGCFERISDFLMSEEQKDFRDFEGQETDKSGTDVSYEAIGETRDAIQLGSFRPKTARQQPSRGQPIVQITQGNFGWSKDKDVLTDINITIPSGRLTCIIGPVASGKSTLCQTLLGETRASKGQVELFVSSREIAYCHQTAHLKNESIKDNIIGFGAFDKTWYETVINACALLEDIVAMPKLHDTIVGSGGVSLSGGQRQKVAVARALYARTSIIILDDVFSGFDARSQQHVFQHVVGPNGIAQRQGMTVIFATHAIKFLPYSDHIIALDVNGKVAQEGSYNMLRTRPGYIQSLAISSQASDDSDKVDIPIESETVQAKEDIEREDLSRQLGDFKIYKYYFGGAGVSSTILMVVFGSICSTFYNLSTIVLKWWTDASTDPTKHNDSMYLGIYGAFQLFSLIGICLIVFQTLYVIVAKTGISLHSRLINTVANASWNFFSSTDIGTITNRFSQDLQLIDMQLPLGVLNVTFSVFVALGQIVIIIASSPWVGLAFPFILVIFYLVQSFYLRTSRQLRFLDLEAKSPLYTNFLETLDGLSTVRAFGWTEPNLALICKLLDISQKPAYLLYMIQRWLTFVLDIIVGVVAVMIATLAVVQRSNSGFTGVALVQVMTFNLLLRSIIMAWTEVETSIGSVSRIKEFSETTPCENKLQESGQPPIDWPHSGKVEIKDMTAIYESAQDSPALRDLTVTIKAGEKFGICGRSGSGKSSLVLALFRMLEIQSGSLFVDGLDLENLPRDLIRSRFNVIPQDSLFIPGTVRENLDPRGDCADAVLIEALKKVQLWPIYEEGKGLDAEVKSDALSHGQRQLFSLASAILRKSKVVVLDEATSNVDHETDQLMQQVIRDEFKGCTIIAIAHRLNTIMDFDRIAVLDHGVLRELDSPQALLSRDTMFRRMCGERGASAKESSSG